MKFEIKGVRETVHQLNKVRNDLGKNTDLLVKRLAELGRDDASVRFETAIYSGTNDVAVTVIKGDESGIANKYKYTVHAEGSGVYFIEFGAGVYYNGDAVVYPFDKPSDVVGIGEYGLGLGKRKGWVYEGDPGNEGKVLKNGKVFTRGTPAQMPMYYTARSMEEAVAFIAKEVFG